MRKPESMDDSTLQYVFVALLAVCIFWNILYPSTLLEFLGGFFFGLIVSYIVRKSFSHQNSPHGGKL